MENPSRILQANSGQDPDWPQVCQRCGVQMPRSRSDRKWCSPACAIAARRARRKAEQ